MSHIMSLRLVHSLSPHGVRFTKLQLWKMKRHGEFTSAREFSHLRKEKIKTILLET